MKNLFLSLSMIVAASTVFASEATNVSEQVATSFKREFPGATIIEWSTTGDFSKATFMLWDHRTEAYFTNDGQLQGSSRSLFYNQLPLAVMTSIDKKFTGADVLDINEISNADGTSYSILLETGIKKYRLKVDAGGNILEIKRIKR